MLDDPGRVRSQMTNVVCQMQHFDFASNLVVTGKVIIRCASGLRLKPLRADRIPSGTIVQLYTAVRLKNSFVTTF